MTCSNYGDFARLEKVLCWNILRFASGVATRRFRLGAVHPRAEAHGYRHCAATRCGSDG